MPGTKIPEEQRQAQILEAAFRVATRAGLQSLTVRSIAREAGISVGLVLFHFKTMDDLQLALLDWLIQQVLQVDMLEEQAPADPDEWLLAILRQQLEETLQQRAEIELFLVYWLLASRQSAIRERIQTALQRYHSALQQVVVEWHRHAQPPAVALPTETLALLLSTVIEGYALQIIHDPTAASPEEVLAALQSLLSIGRSA